MAAGDRHYLLDGLRGVAALMVALFHAGVMTGTELVPRGYLAVDFFFLLSGFVVARAYAARLAAGIGFRAFAARRLARLWPVYAVGCGLGIAIGAGQLGAAGAPPLPLALAGWGLNAVMLPGPPGLVALFATNLVAWSLFAELLVNLAYAAVLFRLGVPALLAIAAAAGAVVVYAALRFDTFNGGWAWSDAWVGLARAVLGSVVGILIARRRLPLRVAAVPAASVVAALPAASVITALLLALAWRVGAAAQPAVDTLLVLVGFPLLLWLAAGIEVPASARSACLWLGAMSYPLYILHYNVLRLGTAAAMLAGLAPLAAALIVTGLVLYLADFVARAVEPPLRRAVSARLAG